MQNLVPLAYLLAAKVTALLLVAVGLTWLLRRQPASYRAASWQAALIAALLLPALSFLLPSWRVALPVASDSSLLSVSAIAAVGSGSQTGRSHLLVWMWGLGFFLLTARIAIGNWIVRRAARAGIRREPVVLEDGREVPVIESAPIHTPLSWGITKAEILVPPGWDGLSAAERSPVLAHGAAHAGRRDSLFQFLAQLASAVYWFHPTIWMAAARLRTDSEMACDDAVLRSGVLASSYADVLLRAANSFRTNTAAAAVTLAMARRSQIQSRIRSILESGVRRSALSRRGVTLAVALALAVIVPLAAMQSGSGDDEVYKISGDIVPPHPIVKPEPGYTQEDRDARIEGAVVLRVEIDKEGRIRRAGLLRGADPGLDQHALDTVKTWRFDPARKAGKPVIVRATIEINFLLLKAQPAPTGKPDDGKTPEPSSIPRPWPAIPTRAHGSRLPPRWGHRAT